MAKDNRPQQFLSVSACIRKGKYVQHSDTIGLWDNDGNGPVARGSIKEEYLTSLIKFLKKHEDDSVSISLFKGKKGKGKKHDDDDDGDDDEDEDDEGEDEDDEDEKPKGKKGKNKKGGKKRGGKWDLDEDDDD